MFGLEARLDDVTDTRADVSEQKAGDERDQDPDPGGYSSIVEGLLDPRPPVVHTWVYHGSGTRVAGTGSDV